MSRSSKMQALRPRPWILLGFIGILGLFGGLGSWAATTHISGAIVAQGTLGVESKIKTVQHLEGGIVGKINVHDGDEVKAGDLLIRLDDTSIRANHAIVSGHLHELTASMARLKAERDRSEMITFPTRLLNMSSNLEIGAMIRGQTSLFEVRKKGKLGQIETLQQRIIQLQEQIKGLIIQRDAKSEQVEILERSIEKKTIIAEKGLISGDTMDKIRRQKSELMGGVGDLIARIATARGSIEEIEQKILQVNKEFREQVLSEIRENQTRSNELREKETALNEKLRRIDIRAPQAGRIHNMSIYTIGGVISPAKSILQIIPDDDLLVVEARIEPTDIDQIRIGQEASINLSAFDSRTTPVLIGNVKKISAARITDTNTNLSFFTVEIVIPEQQRARLNEDQELLPGMPADVFIRTGKRTPLNYFLKPLMDQIQRAFKEQ